MKNYIFIGGVPRSGTSLVQKILSLHSEIYGGPEFVHLPELMRLYNHMLEGIKNNRQKEYYNNDELKYYLRTLISSIFDNKIKLENVNYLSEKTPYNILVFNELYDLFPASKYIIVLRDPRGIINSLNQVQRRAKSYGDNISFGKNIFSDIRFIKKVFNISLKFSENYDNCLIVYYENLLHDSRREVKRICQFIGVEYEASMLDTAKSNSNSKLMGNELTRSWYSKEMYDRSIDRQNSLKWMEELSKLHKSIINNHFNIFKNKLVDYYNFENSSMIYRLQARILYHYLKLKHK